MKELFSLEIDFLLENVAQFIFFFTNFEIMSFIFMS